MEDKANVALDCAMGAACKGAVLEVGELSFFHRCVDGTWLIVKTLLLAIDLTLILSRPLRSLFYTCFGGSKRAPRKSQELMCDKKNRAQVVVVGASFAGLEAVMHLAAHPEEVDVLLVTERPYFEYTPGVLRCLVQPAHFYELACSLPFSSTNVLVARAIGMETDSSNTSHLKIDLASASPAHTQHERVPFDHCLITVGNLYTEAVIKPCYAEQTLPHRAATWQRAHEELRRATSVLVIGGGLVGVELAAEVAVAMPSIAITIVHSGEELCTELPRAARTYIANWLREKKVNIQLARRVVEMSGGHCSPSSPGGHSSLDDTRYLDSKGEKPTSKQCTFDDGSCLSFSLVYQCTGGEGHSNIISGFNAEALSASRYLCTTDTLQVVGKRNVWAAGDAAVMIAAAARDSMIAVQAAALDSTAGTYALHQRPVKNAHTAEQTAKTAAMNILRCIKGAEVCGYPQDIAGQGHSLPDIFCVSLGPYDGVIVFNWLVIPGPLAALMKR
jgi:NADH dehydrogenase FAD-containing subunit